MSRSRFYLPLILIVSILLTSCDKEPYSRCKDDPDCEYFRCKVDGKWWTPDCEQGPLLGCTSVDLQYYKQDGYLSISANSENNNDGFKILALNVLKVKEYNLHNGVNVKTSYRRSNNTSNCIIYNIIDETTSSLVINKLDTSKFIIEANFSFKCENECGELINISDGYFRQHYRF